jgi:hypothetical protein
VAFHPVPTLADGSNRLEDIEDGAPLLTYTRTCSTHTYTNSCIEHTHT